MQGFTNEAAVTGSGTANQIAKWSSSAVLTGSSDLTFDGTDLILGSGIRLRMSGQNRHRALNTMATLSRSSDKTLTTATWTAIDWDAEQLDTDTLHDTASNNSRITTTIAGKYVAVFFAGFGAHATGVRYIEIQKNSAGSFDNAKAVAIAQAAAISGAAVYIVCATPPLSLAAGDHIEAWAYQDSGGDLALHGSTDVESRFGLFYIGE